MQQHLDIGVLPMEAGLLIADGADGLAGDVDDLLLGDGGAAHLAGDHDAIGGGEVSAATRI